MWRPLAVLALAAGCGPSDDGRLRKAKSAMASGDYAAAKQFASTAVQADASQPAGHEVLAHALSGLKEHAAAAESYTQALALNPDRPDLRDRRGDACLKCGRFADAVADFDAVLAARPALAPSHWRRGIALYYAGRFADGAAQFESHRTVNPGDVENSVWHYLCVAEAESPAAAKAKLLPVGQERRPVFPQILDLFAGRCGPEAVTAAAGQVPADSPSGPPARFYADLYLGLYHAAAGEAAKATERLTAAVANRLADDYMGDVAVVHLARLTGGLK